MIAKKSTLLLTLVACLWLAGFANAAERARTQPQTPADGVAPRWVTPGDTAAPTQTVGHPPAASAGLPNVAIVASASNTVQDPWFTDTQVKLVNSGQFASVSVIHAGLTTPSLEALNAFDAVLVWSNFDFADAQQLGENLAQYVNAGHGVVVAIFANSTDDEDRVLAGRWQTHDYAIIPTESGTVTGPAALGTVHDPDHPVMANVSAFAGGSASFRPQATVLSPDAELVAEWDDGSVLVAAREDTVGSRIDLGFYPPSDLVLADLFWDDDTDGGVLLANALSYAATRPPLGPGDSNGDAVIDETDYAKFITCYTGQTAAPVTAGCVTFDFDRDDDVDCFDWQSFSDAWSGRGDPPAFKTCTLVAPAAQALGSRYLSLTAPAVPDDLALFLTGDPNDPAVSCVAGYVQPDGALADTPFFQPAAQWNNIILTDADIIPDALYQLQADYGAPSTPLLSPPVSTTTWLWGDTNNDAQVNIFDIFCVLDGFVDVYENCSPQAVDIAQCAPDGDVDIFDIFAVLDAFQSVPFTDACPAPCD